MAKRRLRSLARPYMLEQRNLRTLEYPSCNVRIFLKFALSRGQYTTIVYAANTLRLCLARAKMHEMTKNCIATNTECEIVVKLHGNVQYEAPSTA